MLNALLILGSTNKKMNKLNYLFAGLWIGYLFINANLQTGLFFTIVNIVTFSVVVLLSKCIKGKYSNMVVSILSVLIWSVLIDIICYFMYPQFTMGQSIIGYIGNGILFNYKYVFLNAAVMSFINLGEIVIRELKYKKIKVREVVTSA